MATLTVNFSFVGSAQTFTGSAGSSCTLTWNNTSGNGSSGDATTTGCLQTVRAVKANSNASSNWARTLTYEDMGVPAGSTVTGISSHSMAYSLTVATSPGASGQTHGAVTLTDGTNTFNLSAAVTGITTVDAAGTYHTSNGSGTTISAVPSSTSATITINNTLFNANTTGSSITFLQDHLTFVLTYTPPPLKLSGKGSRSIDRNLIGHWPCDEGAGVTCYDVSGMGNHGTFAGSPTPTWVNTERFGTALQINSTGYVNLGNIANFGPTDSFSVVYWTKFTSTYQQFNPAIGKLVGVNPFNGWEVYMDQTSTLYGVFKIMDISGVAASAGALGTSQTGMWHLVAAVCDRDAQLVKMSVNGHTFATNSCSAVGSPSTGSSAPFTFGVQTGQTSTLHDIRLYSRAVTQAEVNQIFHQPRFKADLPLTYILKAKKYVPVTHNVTLTETASAADTPDSGATYPVTLTETTSAADTPNSGVTYPVSVPSEAATAADTPANTTTFASTLTESATATDAPSNTAALLSDLTETASAADTPSNTTTFLASLSEAATSTDAPDRTVAYPVALSEAATPTDATNVAAMTYAVAISESATATDAPTTGQTYNVDVSEPTTAAETVDGFAAHLADLTEAATADSVVESTIVPLFEVLNDAGLGIPAPGSPYQLWTGNTYLPTDLFRHDYFTEPTLDLTKWNPWLGGDYFGNLDQHSRFTGRPPNSAEPSAREGGTSGYGPETGFSCWTMWEFSLDPTTGTPIPTFNSEIFDPFPAGSSINLTGDEHLVTGPGVAYPGGGLKFVTNHTPYFAFDYNYGLADKFGQPVRLIAGSTEMTFRPEFVATATITTTAAPGTRVLTFAGGVPVGIMYGMKVTDLTHPDHTSNGYITIGGNDSYHVPCCIESFTATTVTITLPTGAQGVPSGDVIQFQTATMNRLLPDAPYYVFADGVPPGTTITYKDQVALDWTTVSATGAQNWIDGANSDDGSIIIAVVGGGFVWVSQDFGFTWTQRHISGPWNGCAISDSGSTMYVCGISDFVYRSTDTGATWTKLDTFPGDLTFSGAFTQMACSADGTIVYVTVAGGGHLEIWKSINSGATWAIVNSDAIPWYAVACSDDGQTVIASAQLEEIHLSHDGGATWAIADTQISFSPVPWSKVYVTSDGSHMVCVMNGGFLVTSTDYGATWTKQFGSGFPATNTFTACQSDDGSKVLYGNTSLEEGGQTIYYSSNFGANYLPVGGIDPGIWVILLCNNDFTSFSAFDQNGLIYVSAGDGPTIRQNMSNPATITADPTMIAKFSRFGWGSANINGTSMRWPATGAYLQFRSKYPDTRFGANSQIDFYPITSNQDFALSNFSLESGYNEFEAVDPRRQFLVGFFDGTTTGIITPSPEYMTESFRTWGFEYWPDIAFTIYLDNVYQFSTSRAVFNGSISGSTLTITSTVMQIEGGVEVNRWLRYRESSQTLYLHDGAGTVWTVYDYLTGLPVDLNVADTTMAISFNLIESISEVTGLPVKEPNPNMRGENSIALGTYMMIGAQGFHTLADFTLNPGPYEWIISGIELYTLPGTTGTFDLTRRENGNLRQVLNKAVGNFPEFGSDNLSAIEQTVIDEIRNRGHYVFDIVDEADATDGSSHPSRAVIRPGKNAYTPVPTNLQNWYPWLSSVARATNNILAGRQNIVHITISLTANSTTTIVKDSRIGNTSYIGLVPLTAHAAAEIPWFTNQQKGQVQLNHSSNDQTDRSFRLVIQA